MLFAFRNEIELITSVFLRAGLPGGGDGGGGQSLQQVDLPLEVGVGEAAHRHHVLHHHLRLQLRPLRHGVSGLHGAALLEPPVPHLDLLQAVAGAGQLGHVPRDGQLLH